MSLGTIVGALTLTFLITSSRSVASTAERSHRTDEARIALDSWADLLRVADSPTAPGLVSGRLEKITPTEIVFWAAVDNRSSTRTAVAQPLRIRLRIENGTLIEQRFRGFATTPEVARVLVSGAVSTNTWLFTPLTSAGSVVSGSLCAGGSLGLCSLSSADGTGAAGADAVLATVARIQIGFTLSSPDVASSAAFSTSVTLGGGTR